MSPGIILILGFANLFADGFAMASANYQASKAKNEFIDMKRNQEEWEIDNLREQEKEEIRNIYRKKGFKDELLDEIVRTITSRRKVWIDTKGKIVKKSKMKSGLFTLIIGSIAAIVAYSIGHGLNFLIH